MPFSSTAAVRVELRQCSFSGRSCPRQTVYHTMLAGGHHAGWRVGYGSHEPGAAGRAPGSVLMTWYSSAVVCRLV